MRKHDRRPASNLAVGGAIIVSALALASEARADCIRSGTVVTCATTSPNGYDETVTSGREDRTVNISADVADGIDITLSAGGDIAVDQTAGTVTNRYGDGIYLKTTDGAVTGTVGNISTTYNALEIVASDIDVTIVGSVSGTGRGFSGVVFNDVGSVKLTNAGGPDAAITGNAAGVNVWHAEDFTLINQNGSKIVGTARDSSGVFAYDVSGNVLLSNDASSITGPDAFAAWDIGGGITVENGSGTLSGTGNGIDIWTAGGDVKVTNGSGLISGKNEEAIYIAEVTGDVSVSNGPGGRITSSRTYGVLAYLVEGDTEIKNSGGLIAGGSTDPAIYADGTHVSVVNGGAEDGEGAYRLGIITGGVSISSDPYSASDGTGGAMLTNGEGGVIVSDSLPLLDSEITREQVVTAAGHVAVTASGGRISLGNGGVLIGRVELTKSDDTMENSGNWAVTGTNSFGSGDDTLINKAKSEIRAALLSDALETTKFDGLETFTNHGIFSLADGGAGDIASFAGDVSFQKGAAYLVDVDLAGQADLISVDGKASIDRGATVSVRALDGIAFGTDYHVLTAAGGVSGNFGSATGEIPVSAFVDLTSTNTGSDIYLRLDQARAFAAAARTANQFAVAGALETLPTKGATHELRNAVLFLGTDAQAGTAFNLLSGEVHASIQSFSVEQSGLVRSALIDRLRAAQGGVAASSAPLMSYANPPAASPAAQAIETNLPLKPMPASPVTPGPALWATGFGNWTTFDGTANAAGLSGSTGGFLIGADTMLDGGWRVGVAGGYSDSSFKGAARSSSGDSDNWHAGLYGGNQWGAVALRTGLAYTWQDISTSRSVVFPGYADSLRADYDSSLFQAFGELGYRVDTPFASFEPFANLAYVLLDTGAYGETGGASALGGSGGEMNTAFTTLGARIEAAVALGSLSTTLRGMLGWRHAFGDITPEAAQAFIGSASFDVEGTPIAVDAAVMEAGIDVKVGAAATLGVAYNGQFGDGVSQNGFNATLRIDF